MRIELNSLVDAAEIAVRLDVSPRTVHKWRERALGFPEPVKTLAIGPVWSWGHVLNWARHTGRIGR